MTGDSADRPLTIYDVAREAGVSYGTVSRALNGRRDVSESTRKHVLDVAKKLRYTPSPVARGLAKSLTSSVGVVVPGVFDPFSVDFTRGVQEVADREEYAVVTWFASDAQQSVEQALVHFARFRMAGALVLGGSSRNDQKFAEFFPGPIVTAVRQSTNPAYGSVWVDQALGAEMMVAHLASTGRRRIAFVSLPLDSDASLGRLDGYREGMRAQGVEHLIDVNTATSTGYSDGATATLRYIHTASRLPDAIFYASDVLAIGGLHALATHGVRVPQDVAVAGFGDIAAARFAVPSLTTVEQSIEEVGRRAMASLAARLRDQPRDESTPEMEVPVRVVARASTALPG